MTFSECVKKLNDYLTRGIIIVAGSRTRIYLHRKHVRSWLIYSIRFRQRDNNNNSQMVPDQFEYDSDNDLERILFKTNYDYQQTTLYCFPTYDCLAKFGVSFPSSLMNQQRGIDRMPFPSY
ncbi:unnamed protein product [Rotaria socialis]|uniref:Uncharacterized protein n=2 Tax=Rotaria socialis TaxID=392032 RepID=A0A817P525_9BILA|nr:unnamed protein product [Rotaria socialis]